MPTVFGETGRGWVVVDEDLLRLAEFQGVDNAPQVELVIDLRRTSVGSFHPRVGENQRLERGTWIQRASKHAFPMFSRVGTIDFILPLLVSIFICFYVRGYIHTLRT